MRRLALLCVAIACMIAVSSRDRASAQNDLIVDGTGTLGPATFTVTTSDTTRRFDNVCVINGGVVDVVPYANGQPQSTYGNLELIAGSVYVDASSTITARGAGYVTPRCGNGAGPNVSAGGRGGCSVYDSAGGGAHFGPGGRGTIDNPTVFPRDFQDDCNVATFVNNTCTALRVFCDTGLSVAGSPYQHDPYRPEFGAAGGDKGCIDGDGYSSATVGGSGGGRIVIVGLSERGSSASPCGLAAGEVKIDGTLDARGKRGCGVDNDAGGGGAGGSVFVVGEHVVIGASAQLTAAGGLGGDTRAAQVGQPDYLDCPGGSQADVAGCDDCGGGGGGGLISILSVSSTIDPAAKLDVSGGLGGVCPQCNGEAGGGAGELQIDGVYVGEKCDGYDNDFDGKIDEGQPNESCGLGTCATSIASCTSGVPTACMPTVGSDPSCKASAAGGRPRVLVILDTSASMLLDLSGYPTFGDGSVEHPGLDTDGDNSADDSRLFLAREALAQVMIAYPEIDFALARYHQDEGFERSCQAAAWFECQGLVASYDDPSDNSGAVACDVKIGPDPGDTVQVLQAPNPALSTTRSECINYAGSCGLPRRGADVLAGFGTSIAQRVSWLDGKEVTTPGNSCVHGAGGNCEVRGSGPTPLAGSLQSAEDYLSPLRATDPIAACRDYSVILVTDGAESCGGDPVGEATRLHDMLGIDVNVIAVSVLPAEEQSLDALALAGSGGDRGAAFVSSPQELVPALTNLVEHSVRFELCNGLDDDCDGKIDETFPALGDPCSDAAKGICESTGVQVCAPTGDALQCLLTAPGQTSTDEVCNSLDDDCDGAIDEGLDCSDHSCIPVGIELCNGRDDDCNGKIDESDPSLNRPCGESKGECEPGVLRCVQGVLRCVGAKPPSDEICNGRDEDCDGKFDDGAPCPPEHACIAGACRRACDPEQEFPCPVGQSCLADADASGTFCVPSACAACTPSQRCEDARCVDRCAGVKCDDGMTCVSGDCIDCTITGCPAGRVCYERECRKDPCSGVDCEKDELCWSGECLMHCRDADCGKGELCGPRGACEKDACAGARCKKDGDVCRAGKCVADPCKSMTCLAGDVCVPALGCVADSCALVHCPEGETCEVGARGQPVCAVPLGHPTMPEEKPRYVSSGGAGLCSAGAPGSRSAEDGSLFAAGLLALVFRRRLRRRA